MKIIVINVKNERLCDTKWKSYVFFPTPIFETADCQYLHKASQKDKRGEEQVYGKIHYQCAGCKCIWNDKWCVKEHIIQNIQVHFCLNCDDWIKDKTAVFDQGWTMFDEGGFWREDI